MIKFLIEDGYDVKAPTRERGNAGIDFYIPNYTERFEKDLTAKNPFHKVLIITRDNKYFIIIPPHSDVNIPSGVHSFFDENIGLIAINKSGIATKKKLINGACLIDSSYQGMLHCHMMNISDEPQELELGTKVTQFVPYKFDTSDIVVESNCSKEKFYKDLKFTNRKDGGFGSTGLK